MRIHVADAHFHADAHTLAPFVRRIGEMFPFTLQQVQLHRDDNGPGHVGIIVFFDVAAITHIGNEAQQAALADGVFPDDIVGLFVKSHFDILQIPVILNTHISKIHKITSFTTFFTIRIRQKTRGSLLFESSALFLLCIIHRLINVRFRGIPWPASGRYRRSAALL